LTEETKEKVTIEEIFKGLDAQSERINPEAIASRLQKFLTKMDDDSSVSHHGHMGHYALAFSIMEFSSTLNLLENVHIFYKNLELDFKVEERDLTRKRAKLVDKEIDYVDEKARAEKAKADEIEFNNQLKRMQDSFLNQMMGHLRKVHMNFLAGKDTGLDEDVREEILQLKISGLPEDKTVLELINTSIREVLDASKDGGSKS